MRGRGVAARHHVRQHVVLAPAVQGPRHQARRDLRQDQGRGRPARGDEPGAHVPLSSREAQRCAVDCAPYVHAKLQAVHHEHGPTGRYIISDRPMTEEEWIRERAATVIDITPEE
jgi:hypothetical protein